MTAAEDGGKRRNLGRGLSALFGEEGELQTREPDRLRLSKMVPVEFLHPNRFQPRRRFDAEAMASLTESVRDKGVLEPIVVRRHPEQSNAYEIVAGERRWRAAQAARLHEVPVVIRDMSDRDSLEIAIIENIQREDLTPLEEAEGYKRLIDEFKHTQEALAKAVGKSRSHIANSLRLLTLPDAVKLHLQDGNLSAGHARALVTAKEPAALAEQIMREGLTVRDAESLVQRERAPVAAPVAAEAPPAPAALGRGNGGGDIRVPERMPQAAKDPNTVALEKQLSDVLGLRVSIDERGEGGKLTVHYDTLEQLDDVLHRILDRPLPPGSQVVEV
ncbi:MAG: ParB/RepB/Spo0J family partition protein [Alphaproteobacteria bacterium]